MHIIKKYKAPTTVKLISRDGGFWRFESISAVVKRFGVRWIYTNVGEQFRVYSHTSWHHTEKVDRIGTAGVEDDSYPVRHYKDVEFILRDANGMPVTYAMVNGTTWRTKRPNRYSIGRFAKLPVVGPVPRTGKNRRRNSSNLRGRNMRYANAFRSSETFKAEGEVPVRMKWLDSLRQDPWGDDYAMERKDRSWKKYRKTQWK